MLEEEIQKLDSKKRSKGLVKILVKESRRYAIWKGCQVGVHIEPEGIRGVDITKLTDYDLELVLPVLEKYAKPLEDTVYSEKQETKQVNKEQQ